MDFLTKREESGTRKRDAWMPDPGVHLYVRDMLYEDFGIDLDMLEGNDAVRHWIPLSITGALDWIRICGWWIYRNTGIFESDAPYKYVFDYNNYEFDPDQLLIFLEDEEKNKLQERLESPELKPKERSEALPFLIHDYFASWLKGERNLCQDQIDNFIPPDELLELILFSTFMWVLDKYGRDWIYMQDEIIACVYDPWRCLLLPVGRDPS